MEAVGNMGLLFALFGGLALVGLIGGGSDDEAEVDDEPQPLEGTSDADRLIGTEDTSDIIGGDGDDFIVSAGATGILAAVLVMMGLFLRQEKAH